MWPNMIRRNRKPLPLTQRKSQSKTAQGQFLDKDISIYINPHLVPKSGVSCKTVLASKIGRCHVLIKRTAICICPSILDSFARRIINSPRRTTLTEDVAKTETNKDVGVEMSGGASLPRSIDMWPNNYNISIFVCPHKT
jgi:hypothetical protein